MNHPFPVLHARKTLLGVCAYSDEAMSLPVKVWRFWQSDCPDRRQRYVTVNLRTHRILWHS